MNSHWVVVGIGNPYLQDDRAGLAVIDQLEQARLPCRLERIYSAGFEVVDRIRGFQQAVIVDACQLGRPPGTLLEVTVADICSAHGPVNAHAVSLGTALQTGALCFPEEMPADIRILLIEAKEIKEFTRQMSPEVEDAVAQVVERIRSLISATL